MNKLTVRQKLLGLGICIPFVWFSTVIILGSLNPAYSYMSNWASDLGRIEAPHHVIFNSIIIFSGFLFLLTGVGLYYSVTHITGRNVLAVIIGSFVAIFGVNYFIAALFPLPDPLHSGYSIGMVMFNVPLLFIWAFCRIKGSRSFKIIQLFFYILILLINLILMGVGGLANDMNKGLFQRIQALILYSWLAYSCYWLIKYKRM